MNKIQGKYDSFHWFGEVTLDGRVLSPHQSQRVINHSPDGFAWGYAGSGPAQLALGILLGAGISKCRSLKYYQRFKSEFLVNLDRDNFEIQVDIVAWIVRQEQLDAEDRS